ncbi:ATP-dependent zinc protease family protein [Roseibium sp. M-1]
MTRAKKGRPLSAADIIGWREIVSLPELGVFDMRAKIDTGARTSALHAEDQEVFQRDGRTWVRFRVPASRHHSDYRAEVPVLDQRDIKNTSGVPETRIVIRTLLHLGNHHWHVDVSLADRSNMGFDMILGRTAIRRHNVLVDAGRSFLAGKPAAAIKH